MKKKKLSLKRVLLFVPLIAFISFGTFTLAKYVIEEFHGYYLNAKHFYFTSNRLKKNTATYLVNNWSGVGSFNVSFDILSEKNSYVYTDYDIPYTVSFVCPQDVICSLDKTSGIVYSASPTHSDTVTLSVNPTRSYSENERLQIYVEATSTSPYVHTISANFVYVVGKQGITYEIEDEHNRAYMIFKITNAINYCKVVEAFGDYAVGDFIESSVYRTLSNENKSKCVGKNITIRFNPNTILLDTTSNIVNTSTHSTVTLNGTDYINQLNFNIEPISTLAIKFYKINTASDYSYPSVNYSSIVEVNVNE